jgi:2-aminoadipate transaminase
VSSSRRNRAGRSGRGAGWSERFARRALAGGGGPPGILALAGSPDTIIFTGGFPAAETFPVARVGPIVAELLTQDPAGALQYSPTEGLATSRAAIADFVETTQGLRPEPSEVLVTSGGVDALGLLTRVFVDAGDAVVVEAPTYLGALLVFTGAEASVQGVDVDAHGLVTAQLEALLARGGPSPKFLYVIPDHHNPTGLSLSLDRRRALIALCRRHDLLVVEDVAYRELGFAAEPLPSLWSLDPGVVLQIGTFSKILFPGVRLGWAVGPSDVVAAMAAAKQTSDQCSGALGQRIMSSFVAGGHFAGHLDAARALYARRAAAMLDALDRYMPDGAEWTRPAGGFFVWLGVPPGIDTRELVTEARRQGVAFVPGAPFYVDGRGTGQIRLAYSCVREDDIEEGVRRLGGILARVAGRTTA